MAEAEEDDNLSLRIFKHVTPLLILFVSGVFYFLHFAFSNSPGGWAGLDVLGILFTWVLPAFFLNIITYVIRNVGIKIVVQLVIAAIILFLNYS